MKRSSATRNSFRQTFVSWFTRSGMRSSAALKTTSARSQVRGSSTGNTQMQVHIARPAATHSSESPPAAAAAAAAPCTRSASPPTGLASTRVVCLGCESKRQGCAVRNVATSAADTVIPHCPACDLTSSVHFPSLAASPRSPEHHATSSPAAAQSQSKRKSDAVAANGRNPEAEAQMDGVDAASSAGAAESRKKQKAAAIVNSRLQ